MESARRGQGQSFIRAYPIRNGTASILSYLYQNDDGRPSLAKPVGSREQFSTPSPLLARQKECQIIEGHLMSDQVHMCLAIPPKHPVASVIGFLKGKSAIAIARQCGRERNFTGEHFWARGYAVSTYIQRTGCSGWSSRSILN